MKKLLFSISFICYFAVTSGIVINSHYCMKRLVSVHLFETSAKKCGKCGMEVHESNGCCRDEFKVVKLEQDQNFVSIGTPGIAKLQPQAVTNSDLLGTFSSFSEIPRKYNNHSPPLLSRQDTYLLNRVFRI